MSRRTTDHDDLTPEEQTRVRTALLFLLHRFGSLALLTKALRFEQNTLTQVIAGRTVSPAMTFRVARLAEVGVDALLAGEYPPHGTCPNCGYLKEPGDDAAPRGNRSLILSPALSARMLPR